MKIYAVRHGQTDLNAEGRIQGCKSALPLNEKGKKQAQEIANILSDKGIDLIITSPLKRATETADIIAEHLNIKHNKVVKGMRLCERDFGDYEGKLMSEVDVNSLRRWTDNMPTPNGETIRELAGRVFDYLDDRLDEMKDIVNRDRRLYLDDQYDKRHGDNNDIETKYNAVSNALEELDITILFVVHSHVLRTMYWYFNGLPEEGNETVIETENCGFYEFDTKKIPPKMKEYQIILDRQTLEERLKRLSRATYKASYTTCFAMCYVPGDFDVSYVDYVCPDCGKKTNHNRDCVSDLHYAKKAVEEVRNARFKIDAVIDEREYCCFCFGEVNYPMPVLKIRFSSDEEYHEVRTGNYFDYKCLTAFIKCIDGYKGRSENMHDWYHPLVDKIDQIARITGLCPEIVEDWQAWVDKHKKLNQKDSKKEQEIKHIVFNSSILNKESHITIPNGYTKIDDDAFKFNKLSSVDIPNSVMVIGDNAFWSCENLTNVSIPDSVTSIGREAFWGCKLLSEVTIPKNVSNIGKEAFRYCRNLTTISVNEENQHYSSEDGVFFDKEKKTLICCPTGKSGFYIIPDGVTSIAKNAFDECKGLTGVTIPNTVTSIGEDAFNWCSGLTILTIPSGVTNIDKNAFSYCKGLTNLTISNGVESIGEGTFRGCKSLVNVDIPYSITSIGKEAFEGCESLTNINISDNITSIGDGAFRNCILLTGALMESELQKKLPTITAKAILNRCIETFAKTRPSVISATQEQLDNLLCYATISPTGDYGFDRTKYDSYIAHNFGSVAAGISDEIIAHSAVSNEIFTKIHNMKRALTKSEIDELIDQIIELSLEYPPMNETKLINIKNIIMHTEKKKINAIPWTVKDEEYRKVSNSRILTVKEIDDLIHHMIETSKNEK